LTENHEHLWVPVSHRLSYPEADTASSKLDGSCIAPYKRPLKQPTPVVRIDDKTNSPVGLDGTFLPPAVLQKSVWVVYYPFPRVISQPEFIVYARKYLFRFLGRRELILVYENLTIMKKMLYGTKLGIIQSDIDIFFDDSELQLSSANLFPLGKNDYEWF
jgi:hypothetical protein